MSLTLTTHDTRFDDPDAATIAKVLSLLDGELHVLATLAHSELTYLQASGSVPVGFALEHQEGSLDRHYRSRTPILSLGLVTDIFQKYARGDESWRDGAEWEHVAFVPPKIPWFSTWVGLAILLLIVISLIWFLHDP